MKWIVFLALPLIMLGCGGGGSSSGGKSEPSGGGNSGQPADLVGLWRGEIDGYSASVSVDAQGVVRGTWLDFAEGAFYSIYGEVPMIVDSTVNLQLCEHEPGAGTGRTFAPPGDCEPMELSSSTVEGQTIQGTLGGRRMELAYAGETAQPITPLSGCRSISTEYVSQTIYYSMDSTTLNVMADGSVTGSRTERISYNSPTPGPVIEWSIQGEVTTHHVDGVDRLSLVLSAENRSDRYLDGLIWEGLVYFVRRSDDRPPLVYRYSEKSACR